MQAPAAPAPGLRAPTLLAGTLGVLVLSLVALQLRPEGAVVASWWPAAALAAAMLAASTGRRRWAAAGAVLGASWGAQALERDPLTSLLAALVITAEALVTAAVLTRRGPLPALETPDGVVRLLGACAAGAVTVTLGGALLAGLVLDAPPLRSGLAVAASHGSALVLLLPLALPTSGGGDAGRRERLLQWVALLGLLAVTYSPGQALPLSLLPVAALGWAALRCSTRRLVRQTAFTGLVVGAATLAGWGPYAATGARREDPLIAVNLVQLFMLVTGGLLLLAAAVVADRRRALAEVERLVRHDPLTGAGSRRLLEEGVPVARARVGRGTPVVLLLLDLDGFKAVNDTDGHAAGDAVLVEVVRRLRALLRATDLVVRLGGDEFVLPVEDVSCPGPDAAALVERVEAALAAPYPGTTRPVGASTGCVSLAPDSGLDALLAAADAEMYRVKHARPARAGRIPGPR